MNSTIILNDDDINQESQESSFIFYIHIFFAFLGLILYIICFILLQFYYKCFSYIKKRIFIFILIHSINCFIETLLVQSLIKAVIIYILGIVKFYLLLSYINQCFTSKKISNESSTYAIDNLNYIIIGFAISTIPLESMINVEGKYILSFIVIKIVLAILLFRYVHIKMELLLDYFKEKKTPNSSIPDIYLPYMKANYYYSNFSKVNIIFFLSLFFIVLYNIFQIFDLFLQWKSMNSCIMLILEELTWYSIVAGCLILFYSLNRTSLIKGEDSKEENGEEINLAKFSVIDIDVQQDESVNLSERKRKRNEKNEEKKSNENDNEEDEEDKNKKSNHKTNEESESLK